MTIFVNFCILHLHNIAAPTCLDQRLWCISVDAVDSKDVGVWAGVEGGVDDRKVRSYRARYQVALLQTPVACVDAQAQEVTVLRQLAATTHKHESETFQSNAPYTTL